MYIIKKDDKYLTQKFSSSGFKITWTDNDNFAITFEDKSEAHQAQSRYGGEIIKVKINIS